MKFVDDDDDDDDDVVVVVVVVVVVRCEVYFDILYCLGVDHECDKQTEKDRRTDRHSDSKCRA